MRPAKAFLVSVILVSTLGGPQGRAFRLILANASQENN
jgi:hypothetical protein